MIPLINFLLQEEIILDDFTWARYWSIENSSDILNAQELYTVFSEMEIYMRALFNTASFYYKTTNGRMIPKIMFGFKEHQWFPYLATKGILDPQLVEYIQTNENCINCTATKHFYIVDPDLSIYKCRKLPETKITFVNILQNTSGIFLTKWNGYCQKCIYYNGCGGCLAIIKAIANTPILHEPECPYYLATNK